jgi:hypothetical protein
MDRSLRLAIGCCASRLESLCITHRLAVCLYRYLGSGRELSCLLEWFDLLAIGKAVLRGPGLAWEMIWLELLSILAESSTRLAPSQDEKINCS